MKTFLTNDQIFEVNSQLCRQSSFVVHSDCLLCFIYTCIFVLIKQPKVRAIRCSVVASCS